MLLRRSAVSVHARAARIVREVELTQTERLPVQTSQPCASSSEQLVQVHYVEERGARSAT